VRDGRAYEPFPAHEVGAEGTKFVLGKHSGTTAMRKILSRGDRLSTQHQVR
jgi:isopropylmalate/homocitrate/citramalate synthase